MIKNTERVVEMLNEVLKKEFTAMRQYYLHYHLLKDWGYSKLAEHEKKEVDEEGVHADSLTERILLLGGEPDFSVIGTVRKGKNVPDILEQDLLLEKDGLDKLRSFIGECKQIGDYVTMDLLIHILKDEEEHIEHIESEIKMCKEMGLQNYLTLKV